MASRAEPVQVLGEPAIAVEVRSAGGQGEGPCRRGGLRSGDRRASRGAVRGSSPDRRSSEQPPVTPSRPLNSRRHCDHAEPQGRAGEVPRELGVEHRCLRSAFSTNSLDFTGPRSPPPRRRAARPRSGPRPPRARPGAGPRGRPAGAPPQPRPDAGGAREDHVVPGLRPASSRPRSPTSRGRARRPARCRAAAGLVLAGGRGPAPSAGCGPVRDSLITTWSKRGLSCCLMPAER